MLALLSSIEPDPVMLPVTFLIVALLMLIEPEPGMPMSLCAVVRLFISMLPLPTTPIDDSLHIMLLIEMSPLPVIFSFSLSVSMPSFALKLPEPRTDTPLMFGEVTYTLTSLRGFLLDVQRVVLAVYIHPFNVFFISRYFYGSFVPLYEIDVVASFNADVGKVVHVYVSLYIIFTVLYGILRLACL